MKIGKVCEKHPELAGQRDNTNHCRKCSKASDEKYRLKNLDKMCAKSAKHREKYPEQVVFYNAKWWTNPENKKKEKERRKTYRIENKERISAYMKKWREDNKEKAAALSFKWRSENREKYLAHVKNCTIIRRRLISAQKIARFYSKQTALIYQERPKGMVIDHIIPLRGSQVTGLHVPWNLQYLTPFENGRKGNAFGETG